MKLVTEFDGFAQALVSLKVAADLVDTIFSKGASTAGDKAFGRILSDANCAAALQGVAADPDDGGRLGSMLSACIKPEDLGGGVLKMILRAAVVSTLAALGGVISYVWSSLTYLNDVRQHRATYEIDVLHDAPSERGVVVKDLLTAPVPAACQHPAGRLSGGELKGLGPTEGYEFISGVSSMSGMHTVPPVLADFSGDGADDAAAVLNCSAGGVSWPDTVLLYGPGPVLLGSADLDTVHAAEHADVTTMTAENGDIRVRWSTYEGCCSDEMHWSARLHWNGHQLQILDAACA